MAIFVKGVCENQCEQVQTGMKMFWCDSEQKIKPNKKVRSVLQYKKNLILMSSELALTFDFGQYPPIGTEGLHTEK